MGFFDDLTKNVFNINEITNALNPINTTKDIIKYGKIATSVAKKTIQVGKKAKKVMDDYSNRQP